MFLFQSEITPTNSPPVSVNVNMVDKLRKLKKI